jgi:hypothetical protein
MNADTPTPTLEIDPKTAGAIYRLIDNVSLIRMIRDGQLRPRDVRCLLDLWKACERMGATPK